MQYFLPNVAEKTLIQNILC